MACFEVVNQQEYKVVIMQKAETRCLLQRQVSSVDGERVGKLLAQLVKSNTAPSTILVIRSIGGDILSNTSKIVQIFRDYYKNLYTSQKKGMEGVMEEFLGELVIPAISQEERDLLEAPITLAELQQANLKSPGTDGLPIEAYKYYGDVLIPELLKALGGELKGGHLPTLMLEATIIVLQKDGKDPLDVAAYRPISLLCTMPKFWLRSWQLD